MEDSERRRLAEIRAQAAERRMEQQNVAAASPRSSVTEAKKENSKSTWNDVSEDLWIEGLTLLFGTTNISKLVLSQWTSQGLRMGEDNSVKHILLQLQGGPCGVLAPVQAFTVKHLIFSSSFQGDLSAVTAEEIQRSLRAALCETLWRAGNYERGCLVKLASETSEKKLKEALARLEDACALDQVVASFKDCCVFRCFSDRRAFLDELRLALSAEDGKGLKSDLGVLLVLLSLLMSRGFAKVQSDRDDVSQPLITSPFGHASQEVVNLFLSGRAVTNVFDGNMEMGGDYTLKGISTRTQVGFLTLLESLNYMTVGSFLKEPEYPVWVLGSENHYTVLFSLDRNIQEESEKAKREKELRKCFDEYDQSGGGGFIDQSNLSLVLRNANCESEDVTKQLVVQDVVTWHDLWSAVRKAEFEKNGKEEGCNNNRSDDVRNLQLYHINGIAKTIAGETSPQPSTKLLSITLTQPMDELSMSDAQMEARMDDFSQAADVNAAGANAHPHAKAQWCPLVDCIRTRWKEAECHWQGEAPSMV